MKDKELGIRTTSVVKKTDMKEPTPLDSVQEGDSVKAIFNKRKYAATVIKFGGEEELSRLHVNPETEQIINDPRAYAELIESKKKLAAEAKAKHQAQARSAKASNDDILSLEPAFENASTPSGDKSIVCPEELSETPIKGGSVSPVQSSIQNSEPPSKLLVAQTPKVQHKLPSSPSILNRSNTQDLILQLCSSVTPDVVNFLNTLTSACGTILNSSTTSSSVSKVNIWSREGFAQNLISTSPATSSSVLPCFQSGKGKVELAVGTGVFINRNLKASACATAGNDPFILIRELLTNLVGKDRLKNMTAKGQNKTIEGTKTAHTPIPAMVLRVIQGFVAQWIKVRNSNVENPPPQPIPEVSDSKFMRTVTLFCGRVRREADKEQQDLEDSPGKNTRSSAKKRAAGETSNPQYTSCKRSLLFGEKIQQEDKEKEKSAAGDTTTSDTPESIVDTIYDESTAPSGQQVTPEVVVSVSSCNTALTELQPKGPCTNKQSVNVSNPSACAMSFPPTAAGPMELNATAPNSYATASNYVCDPFGPGPSSSQPMRSYYPPYNNVNPYSDQYSHFNSNGSGEFYPYYNYAQL